jgi:hypothetical protein
MLQLIIIKQQQLLHLSKTLFIQTSFPILLRILVKRKLPKNQRKAMKKQAIQTLFLRLLMMAWTPTLGDPTELGAHQNYKLDIGKIWLTMSLIWSYSQLDRQKPKSHQSISELWILLLLCPHLWESDQS